MPANLENLAVATGREKSAFIPIPKKGNAKECSNYLTITLLSHTSKVMLNILQAKLQQYMNWELPDVKLDLEKAEEPDIKLPTSVGSLKSKRVPEKCLFLLYWLCQSLWLCGSWQTVVILKEMGIPNHLTYLLRNQYADQEATVRTRHRTTDWLQIRKGVHQGCILSPRLFNLYAKCTRHNARLDEAWGGIKVAERNINNLRFADDTSLMAESEEELKSFLMKVKEESENVAFKFNIWKMKIITFGSITSWQIDGESMETLTDFIFFSKITADGDCSHEIKRLLLLGRKIMTNLDSILKSRDIILPTESI